MTPKILGKSLQVQTIVNYRYSLLHYLILKKVILTKQHHYVYNLSCKLPKQVCEAIFQ